MLSGHKCQQCEKNALAETLTSYQKNFPLHNLAGIFDAIEEAKKEEVAARLADKEATKKVVYFSVFFTVWPCLCSSTSSLHVRAGQEGGAERHR